MSYRYGNHPVCPDHHAHRFLSPSQMGGGAGKISPDMDGLLAFMVLFRTSLQFLAHQNVVSTAMELPMQLVYLVIPVGAVIYMAYDLGMIVGDIRKMLQRRKDGC